MDNNPLWAGSPRPKGTWVPTSITHTSHQASNGNTTSHPRKHMHVIDFTQRHFPKIDLLPQLKHHNIFIVILPINTKHGKSPKKNEHSCSHSSPKNNWKRLKQNWCNQHPSDGTHQTRISQATEQLHKACHHQHSSDGPNQPASNFLHVFWSNVSFKRHRTITNGMPPTLKQRTKPTSQHTIHYFTKRRTITNGVPPTLEWLAKQTSKQFITSPVGVWRDM